MQARSGELAGRWLGTKDAAANIEPHCFKRLGSPEWYRILTHIPSNCRAPKEPYRILTCVFSQDWAPMGAVSLGPYPFKQGGPEGPLTPDAACPSGALASRTARTFRWTFELGLDTRQPGPCSR